MALLWQACFDRLEKELPAQQFNTWIRPLHAEESDKQILLLAPNRFVLDWVKEQHLDRMTELLHLDNSEMLIEIKVGTNAPTTNSQTNVATTANRSKPVANNSSSPQVNSPGNFESHLNSSFTFDSFVEGKSNQLGRAASMQVAENPGGAYNPLFIYGGVGLGKTHLMHAVGNAIKQRQPDAKVVYLHSERFVADMVRALQHNAINDFKRYYRSLNALLIDDIQFFAGKERSQEEFFHTFNALLEGQNQIVLTCDRYPKEVSGLEERLKSRFGWGLTVSIDPPELETRVAIIRKKAELTNQIISDEVAFFIAKRFRSNVRELEGALNRVIANANLTGSPITIELTQSALHDLLLLKYKQITKENIQKTTAEYYKIRLADILSKRRNRSITRPRQMAMAIAKELTSHSLPEIGDAFGGRDHTTVIHACRKIGDLRKCEHRIDEDYTNLTNLLTA